MMSDAEKDLCFSEAVKAGKRIYYFDVKQSRNGEKYVAITESKRIADGPADNPRFTYEKHKLFLYKEDYEKFADALNKVIRVASGEETPLTSKSETPVTGIKAEETDNVQDEDSTFDIQF
ncbi:MAG: DUF3276 family protein [Prevotellaceae bacterium]|nr:DUF3276 family protein [Candidatus Colivivens caballi]